MTNHALGTSCALGCLLLCVASGSALPLTTNVTIAVMFDSPPVLEADRAAFASAFAKGFSSSVQLAGCLSSAPLVAASVDYLDTGASVMFSSYPTTGALYNATSLVVTSPSSWFSQLPTSAPSTKIMLKYLSLSSASKFVFTSCLPSLIVPNVTGGCSPPTSPPNTTSPSPPPAPPLPVPSPPTPATCVPAVSAYAAVFQSSTTLNAAVQDTLLAQFPTTLLAVLIFAGAPVVTAAADVSAVVGTFDKASLKFTITFSLPSSCASAPATAAPLSTAITVVVSAPIYFLLHATADASAFAALGSFTTVAVAAAVAAPSPPMKPVPPARKLLLSSGGPPPPTVPVSIPPVSVPQVSFPPLSPADAPPVRVPPVGLSPVTAPAVSLPPATVPPVSLPPVSVPPVSVPTYAPGTYSPLLRRPILVRRLVKSASTAEAPSYPTPMPVRRLIERRAEPISYPPPAPRPMRRLISDLPAVTVSYPPQLPPTPLARNLVASSGVAAVTTSVFVQHTPLEATDVAYGAGRTLYEVFAETATYYEAGAACNTRGGSLVTYVDNEAAQVFVDVLCEAGASCWVEGNSGGRCSAITSSHLDHHVCTTRRNFVCATVQP